MYFYSFSYRSSIAGTFGCATGAFSYSSLSTKKNLEADTHNPNLYSSIEDLKDNRVMENIYDEISKRASSASVQRKGTYLDRQSPRFLIFN